MTRQVCGANTHTGIDPKHLIRYDLEEMQPDHIVAEGNVTVVQGTSTLTTKSATWYREKGTIVCDGKTKVVLEEGEMSFEKVTYHIDDGRLVGDGWRGTFEWEKVAPESQETSK